MYINFVCNISSLFSTFFISQSKVDSEIAFVLYYSNSLFYLFHLPFQLLCIILLLSCIFFFLCVCVCVCVCIYEEFCNLLFHIGIKRIKIEYKSIYLLKKTINVS